MKRSTVATKRIRTGTRISAEIRTGDRRVIEYLLSQAVREAGLERWDWLGFV